MELINYQRKSPKNYMCSLQSLLLKELFSTIYQLFECTKVFLHNLNVVLVSCLNEFRGIDLLGKDWHVVDEGSSILTKVVKSVFKLSVFLRS